MNVLAVRGFAAVVALVAAVGCSNAPSGSAGSNLSVQRELARHPASGVAGTGHRAPCGWKHHTTYQHVIWIWMENRSYRQVLGKTGGARRLASFATACGTATNYEAISHPSLPNYVAATSGSTHGISSDCDPGTCPVSGGSLYGQLDAPGGLGWAGYAESMASPCDQGSYGHYAARHNPAVYYSALSASCRKHDLAMGGVHGRFARHLAAGRLPGFSFVTPNLCDDGHDCSTATADSWLGYWLKQITASPLYRAGNTVVFVTWDENDYSSASNQVATVVIGPTVVPGTRSHRHFTHYSLLRTTEDLLHLGHLGNARTAASMASAFNL
ncbi:MAG TPA: alkaline phosphatase family protein [Mycobacteriales bacterium]|nr:alkaline phosphatase family protein [Mycobacteriales bacterium]HWC34196.1 alkaline phosphatase family protein [Mycobacteriales bacterium]